VPLPPQPFAVLEELLRSAGQVVTREEMRRALWPEGVHVDYERGLNYCVNRVRRALGDDAQTPRFVETLPRRGYRFLAEVDAVLARPIATPRPHSPANGERPATFSSGGGSSWGCRAAPTSDAPAGRPPSLDPSRRKPAGPPPALRGTGRLAAGVAWFEERGATPASRWRYGWRTPTRGWARTVLPPEEAVPGAARRARDDRDRGRASRS
jgi:DNA-binding winged helix-turn-helix (wHTH) protein